jgi:hypothetical protein
MAIRFRLPLVTGRLKKIFPIFLCALLLVLHFHRTDKSAIALPPTTARASINRAEIIQILDSPAVYIENKQAKVRDVAQKGQRVRTANARAQLLFNNGAIGRLAHNSVLTIGQCARLQRGSLLVNGALNGCTSSVIAGVRGTAYVLEASDAGVTQVKVLQGEVAVTKSSSSISNQVMNGGLDVPIANSSRFKPVGKLSILLDQPPPRTGSLVVLREGEKVAVTPNGAIGLVEKLSQDEFTRLLVGSLFKDYSTPLPGAEKIRQSFQKLYPSIPFPVSVPGIPGIPDMPIRLPFPFK